MPKNSWLWDMAEAPGKTIGSSGAVWLWRHSTTNWPTRPCGPVWRVGAGAPNGGAPLAMAITPDSGPVSPETGTAPVPSLLLVQDTRQQGPRDEQRAGRPDPTPAHR